MKVSIQSKKKMIFAILVLCWIAFEAVNYMTTEFAIDDILGVTNGILGVGWASLLALAFCGIDFAGVARIFTKEVGEEPEEINYLFMAWILAAMMNAGLTWWAVSAQIASADHARSFVNHEDFLKYTPIVLALMVFVIRMMLIGTISVAGDRLFNEKGVVNPARVKSSPRSGARKPKNRPDFSRPGVLQSQKPSSLPPWAKGSSPLPVSKNGEEKKDIFEFLP